jgi:hypothetical protein
MPSVRVYQKKQIRLDRLNFRQTQMFKIGNVGVATVKNRLAAAQGPDDGLAKPLTKVHITKHGVQALEWDGDARQYVEKEIASSLEVLRCSCHIDTGVTLADVFRIVEQDPDLARFLDAWAWCDLDAFHQETRKPGTRASDLHYIEIAKYFEWDETEARETIHVSGVGDPGVHGDTHYGIDFTPVNELAHLPVLLNPRMEIHRDHKKVGDAPCYFSLLEVLGEIYWEISFYGSPATRDMKRAELDESVREIEEGRAESTPMESLEDLLN